MKTLSNFDEFGDDSLNKEELNATLGGIEVLDDLQPMITSEDFEEKSNILEQ